MTTIYLPKDPVLFHTALDNTCNHILNNKENSAFYLLLVELIECLCEHPFLKEHIKELETESESKKQMFSKLALEALEDNWKRLWKFHRHSLLQRKKMVFIKRIITAPNEITYSPLYNRVLFSMWEFRHYSPFCKSMIAANDICRKILC